MKSFVTLIFLMGVVSCGGEARKDPFAPSSEASSPNGESSAGNKRTNSVTSTAPGSELSTGAAQTSNVSPAASSSGNLSTLFRVKLVSNQTVAQAQDPNLLASAALPLLDLFSDDDENNLVTQDRNSIVFQTKIYLSQSSSQVIPSPNRPEKRWFFVWSDTPFAEEPSVRIVDAKFTHQIVREPNQLYGDLRPHSAWRDQVNQRWFIPIHELFRNQPRLGTYEASLDDLQSIDLTLTLEDRRQVQMKLNFQATEPLPDLSLRSVPQGTNSAISVNSDSNLDLENPESLTRAGRVILTETLQNTSRRTLDILVRTDPENLPSLLPTDRMFSFQSYIQSGIEGQTSGKYLSKFNVGVRRLEVQRSSTRTQTLDLSHKQWGRFALKPQEQVTLRWIVLPDNGVPLCYLPSSYQIPVSRTEISPPTRRWEPLPIDSRERHEIMDRLLRDSAIRKLYNIQNGSSDDYWGDVERACRREVDVPGVPVVITENKTFNWTLSRTQLEGNWHREMRVTYPFTSLAVATVPIAQNSVDGDTATETETELETGTVAETEAENQNVEESDQPYKRVLFEKLSARVTGGVPQSEFDLEVQNFSCQGVFE